MLGQVLATVAIVRLRTVGSVSLATATNSTAASSAERCEGVAP